MKNLFPSLPCTFNKADYEEFLFEGLRKVTIKVVEESIDRLRLEQDKFMKELIPGLDAWSNSHSRSLNGASAEEVLMSLPPVRVAIENTADLAELRASLFEGWFEGA